MGVTKVMGGQRAAPGRVRKVAAIATPYPDRQRPFSSYQPVRRRPVPISRCREARVRSP